MATDLNLLYHPDSVASSEAVLSRRRRTKSRKKKKARVADSVLLTVARVRPEVSREVCIRAPEYHGLRDVVMSNYLYDTIAKSDEISLKDVVQMPVPSRLADAMPAAVARHSPKHFVGIVRHIGGVTDSDQRVKFLGLELCEAIGDCDGSTFDTSSGKCSRFFATPPRHGVFLSVRNGIRKLEADTLLTTLTRSIATLRNKLIEASQKNESLQKENRSLRTTIRRVHVSNEEFELTRVALDDSLAKLQSRVKQLEMELSTEKAVSAELRSAKDQLFSVGTAAAEAASAATSAASAVVSSTTAAVVSRSSAMQQHKDRSQVHASIPSGILIRGGRRSGKPSHKKLRSKSSVVKKKKKKSVASAIRRVRRTRHSSTEEEEDESEDLELIEDDTGDEEDDDFEVHSSATPSAADELEDDDPIKRQLFKSQKSTPKSGARKRSSTRGSKGKAMPPIELQESLRHLGLTVVLKNGNWELGLDPKAQSIAAVAGIGGAERKSEMFDDNRISMISHSVKTPLTSRRVDQRMPYSYYRDSFSAFDDASTLRPASSIEAAMRYEFDSKGPPFARGPRGVYVPHTTRPEMGWQRAAPALHTTHAGAHLRGGSLDAHRSELGRRLQGTGVMAGVGGGHLMQTPAMEEYSTRSAGAGDEVSSRHRSRAGGIHRGVPALQGLHDARRTRAARRDAVAGSIPDRDRLMQTPESIMNLGAGPEIETPLAHLDVDSQGVDLSTPFELISPTPEEKRDRDRDSKEDVEVDLLDAVSEDDDEEEEDEEGSMPGLPSPSRGKGKRQKRQFVSVDTEDLVDGRDLVGLGETDVDTPFTTGTGKISSGQSQSGASSDDSIRSSQYEPSLEGSSPSPASGLGLSGVDKGAGEMFRQRLTASKTLPIQLATLSSSDDDENITEEEQGFVEVPDEIKLIRKVSSESRAEKNRRISKHFDKARQRSVQRKRDKATITTSSSVPRHLEQTSGSSLGSGEVLGYVRSAPRLSVEDRSSPMIISITPPVSPRQSPISSPRRGGFTITTENFDDNDDSESVTDSDISPESAKGPAKAKESAAAATAVSGTGDGTEKSSGSLPLADEISKESSSTMSAPNMCLGISDSSSKRMPLKTPIGGMDYGVTSPPLLRDGSLKRDRGGLLTAFRDEQNEEDGTVVLVSTSVGAAVSPTEDSDEELQQDSMSISPSPSWTSQDDDEDHDVEFESRQHAVDGGDDDDAIGQKVSDEELEDDIVFSASYRSDGTVQRGSVLFHPMEDDELEDDNLSSDHNNLSSDLATDEEPEEEMTDRKRASLLKIKIAEDKSETETTSKADTGCTEDTEVTLDSVEPSQPKLPLPLKAGTRPSMSNVIEDENDTSDEEKGDGDDDGDAADSRSSPGLSRPKFGRMPTETEDGGGDGVNSSLTMRRMSLEQITAIRRKSSCVVSKGVDKDGNPILEMQTPPGAETTTAKAKPKFELAGFTPAATSTTLLAPRIDAAEDSSIGSGRGIFVLDGFDEDATAVTEASRSSTALLTEASAADTDEDTTTPDASTTIRGSDPELRSKKKKKKKKHKRKRSRKKKTAEVDLSLLEVSEMGRKAWSRQQWAEYYCAYAKKFPDAYKEHMKSLSGQVSTSMLVAADQSAAAAPHYAGYGQQSLVDPRMMAAAGGGPAAYNPAMAAATAAAAASGYAHTGTPPAYGISPPDGGYPAVGYGAAAGGGYFGGYAQQHAASGSWHGSGSYGGYAAAATVGGRPAATSLESAHGLTEDETADIELPSPPPRMQSEE